MKDKLPNDIKKLQIYYDKNFDITNDYNLVKDHTVFLRNLYTITAIGFASFTTYCGYHLLKNPVDSLKLLTGLGALFTLTATGSAIKKQIKIKNTKGRR